jgi:antitoxin MazE
MDIQVNQWGNSSGIRLPKALLEQLGAQVGTTLKANVENGRLVLEPKRKRSKKPRYTLEELCAQMTPENRPDYIDWGPPVGREIIEDDWS